jgi:hypothetical protein
MQEENVMKKRALLLMAVLVVIMPTTTRAGLLTFTFTGNGSGTLNNVSFSGSDFVITSIADTANRQSFSNGWWIENNSSSIWISGLGNFNFLSATREFVNNNKSTVGFSRGNHGTDLINGLSNTAFGAWDMSGPVGPINGMGKLLQWTSSWPAINTTGGVLKIDNGMCPSTYTVVPEPASFSLLSLGALALIRRTRS